MDGAADDLIRLDGAVSVLGPIIGAFVAHHCEFEYDQRQTEMVQYFRTA